MGPASDLEADLRELGSWALRRKYKKESSTHANIKRRCKLAYERGDASPRLADEWSDFRAFLRDVGRAPTPTHSIDRIDYDDPEYGPGKVRWATKAEQTANRRNTRYITYRGERVPLSGWVRHHGLVYKTVHAALSRGATPEEILNEQAKKAEPFPGFPHPFPEALFFEKFETWKAHTVRRRDRKKEASPLLFYAFHALEKIDRIQETLGDLINELIENEEFLDDPDRKLALYHQAANAGLRSALILLSAESAKVPSTIGGFRLIAKSYRKWLEEPPLD